MAHIASSLTALEILRNTNVRVDILVAGLGTGCAISGLDETLKAHIPYIRIAAVKPFDSPLLSEAHAAARTGELLTGISAEAALHAASLPAQRSENVGKRNLSILPDTGERDLFIPPV